MSRHRRTTPPKRHGRTTRRPLVAAAAVAVTMLASYGALAVTDDPDPAPAAGVRLSVTTAQAVYLAELREAGVTLDPAEQAAAVGIADEHVAHGHLVGMREIIRADFRKRIPRLTDAEVEIAKVAVEHHFLAVTGRKQ